MNLQKFQNSFFILFICIGIGYSQRIVSISKIMDVYGNEAIEIKNFNYTLMNEICERKNCDIIVPKKEDTSLIKSDNYLELIKKYSAEKLIKIEYRRYGGRYHLNVSLYNEKGNKEFSKTLNNLKLFVEPKFYNEMRKVVWDKKYSSYYFDNEEYSKSQRKSRFSVKLGQLYPDGSGFRSKRYRERERLNPVDSTYFLDTSYIGEVYSDFNFQLEYIYRVNNKDELGLSVSFLSGNSSILGLTYSRSIFAVGIINANIGGKVGFAFLDDDQIDLAYYYGLEDVQSSDDNNGIYFMPTFEIKLLEKESVSLLIETGYLSVFGKNKNSYGYLGNIGLAKNF